MASPQPTITRALTTVVIAISSLNHKVITSSPTTVPDCAGFHE
ncbi:hypothetical protein B0H03_10232 [Rathayibacter iranicus NCPPB 2253 = VKM Ac-1602]|uniref:Uncharacterized protein n=1 Tax=Rathayibacter iranicus NCPPB 2253 = VKM Ac-1602 TaxID=1328868 RepID=A0ABX5LIW6_9MICO|nr:hypothetical protein B0H03_10232 [Rathayibacter iranicus NCPPB 2253 = VKM Ac-1602]